jgi:hypothetical protein
MCLWTSALVAGGNCAALSLERGLDLRKGAVEGQNLPSSGHIAVHQDEVRQEDFVEFYFEIYTHVIDIYIYHSRVYISSIFVNEKALT